MKIRNTVSLIIVGIILISFPLILEWIMLNGIFGFFIDTTFDKSVWFSFWGSYVGAVITIGVLIITIRYNQLETEKRLREYEIDRKYDLLLADVSKMYNFITLQNLDSVHVVYKIRVEALLFLEMARDAVDLFADDEDCEFLKLFLEVLDKYINETIVFNGVKLTNENRADYIASYEDAAKKITKIMHANKNDLTQKFIIIKKEVECKRIKEKKNLY